MFLISNRLYLNLYRTHVNIILPADNITLSGELEVIKEIYIDQSIILAPEKQLRREFGIIKYL